MPYIFPPINSGDDDTMSKLLTFHTPTVQGPNGTQPASPLGQVGGSPQAPASDPQQDLLTRDYAALKAKQDAYEQPAHGILGHIAHFFRPSEAFETNPLRENVAQDQAASLASKKESDTVANEGANREQKGDIESSKEDVATAKTNAALAGHGFKLDPEKGIIPLSYEELSPTQQAAHDLKQSQGEQAEATAQLRAAQAANAPEQIKIAQSKLASIARTQDIALQRIGLSREALGFQEDKQYNPQPTAQERNKGDLAQSSIHQIGEMRDVLDKRPDIFGPGAGRGNRIQQWLGSSDPDAIKYRSSSQYLADHSAALFGGRGEYIMKQLHDLTDERFGPDALKQALTEAETTSQGFKNAGTVHSKGGSSSYSTPAAGSPGKADYVFQNGKLVKQ